MNIWFTIYLLLQAIGLGISLGEHGEPKNEDYNFFTSLIGGIISTVIVYMAIKVGF